MGVSGKIFVVPVPRERTWKLVVHNDGTVPFGLTHNILPSDDPDAEVHDDHVNYGHGLPVDPGQVSWQKFHEGDNYDHQDGENSHAITEDCHLRLSVRRHCHYTIPLPPLDSGPVELDLASFNWYGGTPADAKPKVFEWKAKREHCANVDNGQALLSQIRALLAKAESNDVRCEGSARVTAVRGEDGSLSHWEVWFKNDSDQPWVGTCAFTGAAKNDGLGLEAMAVPGKDCEAMQRIEYLGNYGVEAQTGARLRLGVRGFAWTELKLPVKGSVEIPLEKFNVDSSKSSPEYFDRDKVLQKRDEKRARVHFREKGKAINDQLGPVVLRGEDAIARSTFDPPRLRVRAVKASKEAPRGGWRVELESRLPEFDEDGRVGFVAALKLQGADPLSEAARSLGPQTLGHPKSRVEWFIPAGADLGGAKARQGSKLLVATRGLGWFAEIELPKGTIDSAQDDSVWALREDQYNRRKLDVAFLARFAPDPER